MKSKLILPEKNLYGTNGTKAPDKVFLGMPTRSGLVCAGSAQAAMVSVTAHRIVLFRASAHTNLELNYNMLLCDALNLRDRDGVKWFAMLHDDIQPDPFWLDVLIDEAEACDADVMSAHVPLKDTRGLSSTAISDPYEEFFAYTRLTLKQIHHPEFPETVNTLTATESLRYLPKPYAIDCPSSSQLLINTGCIVMRVDRPWMDRIRFHKKDAIVYEQGVWTPLTWTEDWMLAQDLHDVGASVMATRKVLLTHWDGRRFFPSLPDEHGQDVDEATISVRQQRRAYQELKQF